MKYDFYLYRVPNGRDPLECSKILFPPDDPTDRHPVEKIGEIGPDAVLEARETIGSQDDIEELETGLEMADDESPRDALLAEALAGDDPAPEKPPVAEEPPPELEEVDDRLGDEKRQLSISLVARHPSLEFPESITMAERAGAPIIEILKPYDMVELNSPETGVRVEIFDNIVRISIPLLHEGPKAQAVFGNVWEYISNIRNDTGYVCYDPQRCRMIRATSDVILGFTVYQRIMSGEQIGAARDLSDTQQRALFSAEELGIATPVDFLDDDEEEEAPTEVEPAPEEPAAEPEAQAQPAAAEPDAEAPTDEPATEEAVSEEPPQQAEAPAEETPEVPSETTEPEAETASPEKEKSKKWWKLW